MVHIIWILMCPHVRGWSRPQGPWLETTGSVQVQVSRRGREQRGGGQWNAKLLSLSHSYQDDAPELSRLLVGHRISDITSKYKIKKLKPFKLETMVLCKITIMVDNQHRRIRKRPLWHCQPCEQKLRGCSSDLTDWSEAGLMVWWMYRPMDLILGPATCGVTATLCWPATHLHNIGFYQQNTQSPCSSKYWFRYLMCVVLRLYWRWQLVTWWHNDTKLRRRLTEW